MQVYLHPDVQININFYKELLKIEPSISVRQYLEKQANHLFKELQNKNPIAFRILDFYSINQNQKYKLNEEDSKKAVALDYGFDSWNNVSNDILNYEFEKSVNAIVTGKVKHLQTLLDKNRQLINQKSNFGHGASLIHYISSNGVEIWRQQVPENLLDILLTLIKSGADTNSKMKVYGGEFTMSELFTTSSHPKNAGIYNEIIKYL